MNSISLFRPDSQEITEEGKNIQYHHHTVEVIQPKPQKSREAEKVSTINKIKAIAANAITLIGMLIFFAASIAITVQSFGLMTPLTMHLGSFMMPSIVAILAGFNLSNDKLNPAVKISAPSGFPGLTIGA